MLKYYENCGISNHKIRYLGLKLVNISATATITVPSKNIARYTATTADHYLWQASMACFVLAALTGFLYRLGILGWMPGDLAIGNVRHAHSHLMFFGWAVPLPFYIILQKIVGSQKNVGSGYRWMRNSLIATLLFGLMAYPFFLFYGYRPIAIGSASLPLSVIFSGLVMTSWYGFIIGYLKSRSSLTNDASLPWIDGALTLLFICSLGAWGVAVVQEVATDSHLIMKSMTHFFLAAFTEGWVVLVLLAILISERDIKNHDWPVSPQLALGAIAIGAPLTFPYGISETLLSPLLLGTARFGGGLAALGLLVTVWTVFKTRKWKHPVWIWGVALLALKGFMQLIASVVPSSFWLSDPGLRVLYLHILLLGGFTLLVISWLQTRSEISNSYFHSVGTAIIVTLVTLLMPTGFWPQVFSDLWILYALAAGALLPILAVSIYWIRLTSIK